MPGVISILHHPIPSISPGKIAEEDNFGWHFRSALALKKYGSFNSVATRPNADQSWVIKKVSSVPVILTPSINLSPSNKIWKWSFISPNLINLVKYFVKKLDYIPYIHEYRTLNSELIIKSLIDYPMILQHHGSTPPRAKDILSIDPVNSLKSFSKFRRESILKKVRGAIFVLNRYEKNYLESLGVDAFIRIRTMAVDFNDLKPPSIDERNELRRSWGLSEDSIVLLSYVGVFGEEFSHMKGAHLIVRLWRDLRRYSNKIILVITGVGENIAEVYNKLGVKAYTLLSHNKFIELIKVSDIYFLMATPDYYGGAGVAIMEALALGKPVVSPTLNEYPELIKTLGINVPYIASEKDYRTFLDSLIQIIENLDNYDGLYVRDLARKYFSWESFVKDFIDTVKRF